MCRERRNEDQPSLRRYQPNNTPPDYRDQVTIFDRSIIAAVTKSHESIDLWIQHVQHHLHRHGHRRLIVGLGVDMLSANAVATIQLCFDTYCIIYHMFGEASFPLSLKQFLSNPDNTFVGLDLDSKLKVLKRDAGFNRELAVQYVDLRVLADYFHSASLSPLVTHVLRNFDLVRPEPDTRWDSLELSCQQVEYASIGAYVSLQIGRLLLTAARENPQRVIFREKRVDGGAMERVHEVQILDRTILATVTHRLIAVEKWMDENMNDGLPNFRYVGFNLEFFTANNQSHIGTVQLCVGRRCLVIQLHQMKDVRYLPNLERFLLGNKNILAGVGVRGKMSMLKDMLLFGVGGRVKVFDLGICAANVSTRPELNNADEDTLSRFYIGMGVEKPEVGSDWGGEVLSDAQVECACIDAAVYYEIITRVRRPRPPN